jgi:nucleotide-binding universal stress UspA family protein
MPITVLIGVDGSANADAALRFGNALARELAARVIVAAAYVSRRPLRGAGGAAIGPERADAEDVAERAREAITGVADVRSLLVAGTTPPQALHRAAEIERADLLVVGSSERLRIAGMQPGSIAEQVLHLSPCPVAVVPQLERDPAFARIGVAVDDGLPARAALDLAMSIAADAGGERPELELLHVAAPEPWLMRPGVPAPEPEYDFTPLWLEAMAARAGERVRTSIVRDTGDASRRLVQITAGLDLLVMGSRDQSGLRRLVLGSTSAPVVRHAACPVIVVPAARVSRVLAPENHASAGGASVR